MRCEKSRRYLPLLAGNDLSSRLSRKLRAHLQRCASCRREAGEYRAALDWVKAAARREDIPDWDAAEWNALMVRIAGEKAERKSFAPSLPPRWAVASGLGAVLVLGALALLFKDAVFKPKDIPPASGPSIAAKEEPGIPDEVLPGIVDPGKTASPTSEARGLVAAKRDPAAGVPSPEQAADPRSQEVLSVTLVSQETGLQVVWFLHKDFDWKGDEK